MAFKLNSESIYVKGTADIWVYNIATGDVEGYSDKLDTANISSSGNNGEVRAGLGAPVVTNLPDSSSFTGEVTAQDFSLAARQFQTGGTLKYNGAVPFREKIKAVGSELTVSQQPVSAYGEASSDTEVWCLVGDDGVNYKVDKETKKIVDFVAETGKEYCVQYFREIPSAQLLSIPTTFAPGIKRVMIRMAAYKANTGSELGGSFAGYVYVHIPRAQFIGGSAGIDGSQTSNSTTSWQFTALSYKDTSGSCAECAMDDSVLGYMVYAPCGDPTQEVSALLISGGGVTVAPLATETIPVKYVMPNNQTIQPDYSALTFTLAVGGDSTAKVDEKGVVTGVAQGNTTITVALKNRPEIKAVCDVTVTA